MLFIVYHDASNHDGSANMCTERFLKLKKKKQDIIIFPSKIFPSKLGVNMVSPHTSFRLYSIGKPFRFASSKSFATILKTETQIQQLQIYHVFNECKNVYYLQ